MSIWMSSRTKLLLSKDFHPADPDVSVSDAKGQQAEGIWSSPQDTFHIVHSLKTAAFGKLGNWSTQRPRGMQKTVSVRLGVTPQMVKKKPEAESSS